MNLQIDNNKKSTFSELLSSWTILWLVVMRSLQDLSLSISLYIILSAGFIGVYMSTRSLLKTTNDGYAVVLSEPFSIPVIAMCILSSLIISLLAGLSIIRDRELGILETFFYGPISHLCYITADVTRNLNVHILNVFL